MATYSHGIASTETGALGLYQSWENTDGGSIITALDADGDVIDYAAITREQTCNVELILDTTKTIPAFGTLVTLTDVHLGTSKAVVLEEVTSRNTNNDFIKVSFMGKRWPTNSIPN